MSENESKKARRNAARERARAAREKAKARKRRNRTIGISSGIVVALAIIAVVVVVISNSTQQTSPGPKNMASDGIVLHGVNGKVKAVRTKAIPANGKPTATKQKDSVANITVYEDYMCPYCNQFETTNMTQITKWVKSGSATLELHPFNLLDSSSLGTKYSTRAANAAACVANYDPDKFLAVNEMFYKHQPSEGTKGLTDTQLVKYVQKAGVTNSNVASCITSGKFKSWVASATSRALNDKIPNSSVKKLTGTPLVIVNGKEYGTTSSQSLTSATAFAQFVEETMSN